MEIQKVKELALANGFSLKEQASGNMDLHSYVYEFANAVEQTAKAQAVPKDSVAVSKWTLALALNSIENNEDNKDIIQDLQKLIHKAQEPAND